MSERRAAGRVLAMWPVLLGLLALAVVPALRGRGAVLGAQTHLIIVGGLGGERQYREQFTTLGATLAEAAHARFGIPDSEILWLGEDSASARPRYRGASTKINVERAFEQLARRAGPGDQIVVVLLGHGSGEGAETRISIPGPDLTAGDFARLLGRFATQKLAFINLTSASGDMIPVLAGPNRVIITATKSAFERNESHFAGHFVDALTKDGADADKDGRVSLLEAFHFATAETKRFYDADSRLQTEHAQLDDMGTRDGAADPDGRSGQGMLARRFFLDVAGASQAGANNPRLTALYKDKFGLEAQIDALRVKKSSMTADAYDDSLEQLLVPLARTARTIRELEGRGKKP